jgi:hypothetical protein
VKRKQDDCIKGYAKHLQERLKEERRKLYETVAIPGTAGATLYVERKRTA